MSYESTLPNPGFSHKMVVVQNMIKGVTAMKSNKKAVMNILKKYILPTIAGIVFVAYGIWDFSGGDQIGGLLGIGAAILVLVGLIYNLKVDREYTEQRQELEAKAPQIPDDLSEKVRSMKAQNQDIQAIKLVREQTGMSLYDATNYVDSIDA